MTPSLLAALAALLLASAPQSALACTTIIVGKLASTDGSIYIARNVDRWMPGFEGLLSALFGLG